MLQLKLLAKVNTALVRFLRNLSAMIGSHRARVVSASLVYSTRRPALRTTRTVKTRRLQAVGSTLNGSGVGLANSKNGNTFPRTKAVEYFKTELATEPSVIIVLDGPTNCGKTELLNQVMRESAASDEGDERFLYVNLRSGDSTTPAAVAGMLSKQLARVPDFVQAVGPILDKLDLGVEFAAGSYKFRAGKANSTVDSLSTLPLIKLLDIVEEWLKARSIDLTPPVLVFGLLRVNQWERWTLGNLSNPQAEEFLLGKEGVWEGFVEIRRREEAYRKQGKLDFKLPESKKAEVLELSGGNIGSMKSLVNRAIRLYQSGCDLERAWEKAISAICSEGADCVRTGFYPYTLPARFGEKPLWTGSQWATVLDAIVHAPSNAVDADKLMLLLGNGDARKGSAVLQSLIRHNQVAYRQYHELAEDLPESVFGEERCRHAVVTVPTPAMLYFIKREAQKRTSATTSANSEKSAKREQVSRDG